MKSSDPDQTEDMFDATGLTWAVLLGRWTDFARSAVALPLEGEGGLLRDSVADLIGLQAVWFALTHLDDLASSQRNLGLDRGQVLIDRHEAVMRKRFESIGLPQPVEELIRDARTALEQARRDK